jgi:hypothetical protein
MKLTAGGGFGVEARGQPQLQAHVAKLVRRTGLPQYAPAVRVIKEAHEPPRRLALDRQPPVDDAELRRRGMVETERYRAVMPAPMNPVTPAARPADRAVTRNARTSRASASAGLGTK